MLSKDPLVSVNIITYNHEHYIAQAIEGALMQKTNFPYEVLIGEDDSSDGTREICKEYAAKYPDKIRLFLNDRKNVIYINGRPTGRWNFINLLKKAKGKYIAICEGDDYWTDPYKLQKQVDFLEANSDYGLVHSDANILFYQSGKEISNYNKSNNREIPKKDIFENILMSNYPVFTCTVCLNTNILNKYVDYNSLINKGFLSGDTFIWLECARHKKFKYLDEALATRCILEESAAHSNDVKKILEFKKSGYELYKYFIKKYGCSKEVEKIVHQYMNKVILKSAFDSRSREETDEAYANLKNFSAENEVDLKSRLYCWGSKKKLNWVILRGLIIPIKLLARIL